MAQNDGCGYDDDGDGDKGGNDDGNDGDTLHINWGLTSN